MADTAIKNEEEKKEFFDSPEVLDHKITMLAEMVLSSQHMVSFTGAGISTACGIPDFRSGYNTVLPTGPGAWETAANKEKYRKLNKAPPTNNATIKTAMRSAYPSKTHMALRELMERGHLKYLVSQNTDGLHRKSGIHPDYLSELHGNSNLGVCEKCGQEFLRDGRVRNA
jgi:NAD-dependent SIR2 family protein deacetylase